MTWSDDQIAEALERRLGAVEVPTEIPPATLRRARARRRGWIATAVATVVLTVSAGAWGAVALDRDDPAVGAASEQKEFVRFLTEPRGVFEIEPSQGQACYRFEMRGATSAHVHHVDVDDVVLELPANEAGLYGYLGCVSDLDGEALEAIAHRPEDHVIEFHNSSSGGTEAAYLQRDVGEPDCLFTELTSSEYDLHLGSQQGEPGDEVRVWGPTLRGEDGLYATSGGLELWWNAETPAEHQPIEDGPALHLAAIDTNGRCYFQTTFVVPDVPDGTYPITGFVFDDPRSEGYGVFGKLSFTVGAAASG